jgi:hypothetical protein
MARIRLAQPIPNLFLIPLLAYMVMEELMIVPAMLDFVVSGHLELVQILEERLWHVPARPYQLKIEFHETRLWDSTQKLRSHQLLRDHNLHPIESIRNKIRLCSLPGEGCLDVNLNERNRYEKALNHFNNGLKKHQELVSHYQAMIGLDTVRLNDYLYRVEHNIPEDVPSTRIRSWVRVMEYGMHEHAVDRYQYPRFSPDLLAQANWVRRPVVDLLTDVLPHVNPVVEAEPWHSVDSVIDHLTIQLDDCPKSRVQAQHPTPTNTILDTIIEPSIISLVLVHYHQWLSHFFFVFIFVYIFISILIRLINNNKF